MRQQLFNVLKVGEEDPTYYNGKSLEIHGIPESVYTSTEEVVLKLEEALEVGVLQQQSLYYLSQDIEISRKLPGKGTKPSLSLNSSAIK